MQSIAPSKLFKGDSAWDSAKTIIPSICSRPIILGRSKNTQMIRSKIFSDLQNLGGLNIFSTVLTYDCCEKDLRKIEEFSYSNSCDCIIACGGGKVLDAGKLIADRLKIPCITVPTSAATCAGWTSLSNIYSKEGRFIKDIPLSSCPDILIFDHRFIKTAPKRTLSSGIADALAKWYESSITSGSDKDGMTQQAVQMARVLRDQLFIDGCSALNDTSSYSWKNIINGCGLTAGMIGGLGGAKCRTAAAHALHNGLTQLEFKDKPLHGELVGVGILIQLKLEELMMNNNLALQSIKQLTIFMKKINLPISIDQLNLKSLSKESLMQACDFACKKDSDIYLLPFEINKEILFEAIVKTNLKNLSIV
tara:strand:+ start:17389 stop:18480 length:1092 start_codon:yes stop_codon:yes gene_type:complete